MNDDLIMTREKAGTAAFLALVAADGGRDVEREESAAVEYVLRLSDEDAAMLAIMCARWYTAARIAEFQRELGLSEEEARTAVIEHYRDKAEAFLDELPARTGPLLVGAQP